MTIIASTDRNFAKALRKIALRSRFQGAAVESNVRIILKAVERGGDRAVLRYTQKFDRLSLKLEQMRVGLSVHAAVSAFETYHSIYPTLILQNIVDMKPTSFLCLTAHRHGLACPHFH